MKTKRERGAWLLQIDGEWVGRWNDPATGRRRQLALAAHGIDSAPERERWRLAKAGEVRGARRLLRSPGAAGRSSLEDAVEVFLADCRGRDLRASTIRRYREALSSCVEWLRYHGRRATSEVTGADLMGYRAAVIREAGQGATTKGNHLARLQAGLEWLRRHRFLPQVTSDEIADACAKPERRPSVPVVLRVPELQELVIAAAERRGGELVAAALLSGCRIGELEALRWDWLALDAAPAGAIHLPPEATKTRRPRTIDLAVSPALCELLRALPRRGPFVFGGAKALNRNTTWELKLANRVLPWTWKHLRSTCGTFLTCAPGVWGASSAYLTARQLGHSVQIAERHYLGVLRGIPATARTLEAAMEIELPLAALIARLRG
ncbi:MAG: hypothetical protein KF878_00325 [Planctomycetes bacterium]|nr:hypothetical protein [Planctomycetota bacterium]